MIHMFISILVVALGLYATIFIHEWLHYLAAKKQGIPTQSLNLGLGPILLSHKGKFDINIRLMPIGGYLEIPDMAFFKPTGITRRQRCIIALAGPFGNLLFCFYLAVILSMVGIPIYDSSLTIGYVGENEELTLKPGDIVQTVNGTKPKNWSSILGIVYGTHGTNMTLVAKRGSELITNVVPIIIPGLVTPRIPLSPAQELVCKPEPLVTQKIISINGNKYFNSDTLVYYIHTNLPVTICYQESGKLYTNTVRMTRPFLYTFWENNPPVIHANPLVIVGGTAWMLAKSFAEVIIPGSNLNVVNLSGPLTTMLYLQRFFDTDFRLGLFLIMTLNLNLFLFNLFPVYPMDGSHVMLAILERTKYLNFFKKIMYFVTWFILFLLVWMLLVDVIKFAVL